MTSLSLLKAACLKNSCGSVFFIFADPDPLFSKMRIRILTLLNLIKMIKIRDSYDIRQQYECVGHWPKQPEGG